MELEQEVATALELLGYTVFYRNLNIIYNRSELSEFDIVCSKFIVEVKSGVPPYKMNGFRTMLSHRILPKEFKYFVYCKSVSDDELKHLTKEYDHPSVQFINTLQPIVEQFPPEPKECWIDSQGMFSRFLNLPMATINQFKTIYMTREIFLISYNSVLTNRDSYSKSDNIRWSEKAARLFTTGVIQFCDECPNHVLMLKKGNNSNTQMKIKLAKLERFTIPLIHNISMLNRCQDIEDIYINPNPSTISINTLTT